MKLDRNDLRVGIAIRDGRSLPARRRATIENAAAVADQSCNELGGFILNHTEAGAERRRFRNVPAQDSSRGGKESAGSEFDSFGPKLLFCFRTPKPDCGHGNRLIVLADAKRGIESVRLDPAFDEPGRMGAAGGEQVSLKIR